MSIGRGQSSEVRITDISVSRIHSYMFLNSDGSVTLIDNNSKYGTLKLLQEPTRIPGNGKEKALYLQCGKVLLALRTRPNVLSCWSRAKACLMKKRRVDPRPLIQSNGVCFD